MSVRAVLLVLASSGVSSGSTGEDARVYTKHMRKFAEACERVAGTTKTLAKVEIVAEYFKACTLEEASVAAVFFSGGPFAAWEESTLQVGGRLLWQIVAELSGRTDSDLTASYRSHGDLGSVAEEVLANRAELSSTVAAVGDSELTAPSVQTVFRKIASARGPVPK